MKKLSEIIPGTLPNNFRSYVKLKKTWESCAGDTISFITTPGSLKDGTFNIAVHDQTWLSELAFFKGELTSRLKEHGVEVSNINFYYRPRKEQYKPVNIPKKEMTQREKDFADRLISTVKDEKLRESFRKAIYGYFTVYTLDDYLNC
jgi:hypothetical protein